jgi:DNA-binding NtrC family response regulator
MRRETPNPSGRRVLLVEDETRLREMLLRAIAEMGLEPAGAGSAEQAQRVMEHRPAPVVIVDLNLPAASGLDLLRILRARWPDTQAIILTGFGDLDAAQQAIRLDVVDFLTKPCALGDLEIALSRAFQRLLKADPTALIPDHHDQQEQEEAEEAAKAAAPPATAPLEFTPREGSEALSMEDVERRTILTALEKHNGNRTATAAELGISLRKLYYRLAQYQKQGMLTL